MDDKLRKLRESIHLLFGDDYFQDGFIAVSNNNNELILSANREGMLLLIDEMLKLCEHNKSYSHYHLDHYDNAGVADKCDKHVIIQMARAPWDAPWEDEQV